MNKNTKGLLAAAASIFFVIGGAYLTITPTYLPEVYPVAPKVQVQKYPFTVYFPDRVNTCLRDNECKALAEAIYFEARGENREGQIAVAHVILNRTKHPSWPDTVQDVITHRCQFTYRCDGSIHKGIQEKKAWENALKLAYMVYNGIIPDPTNGADHYANPAKVKIVPRWMKVYDMVAVIGNHHFYKR